MKLKKKMDDMIEDEKPIPSLQITRVQISSWKLSNIEGWGRTDSTQIKRDNVVKVPDDEKLS